MIHAPAPLGPVMLDVEGFDVSAEEAEKLAHPAVGGLILFRRNYESHAQLEALIHSVRKSRPNLLISVDHEGGRVQRFREGFTRLPAASAYSNVSDDLIERAGWLMAAELRAFDIDFSFAPVLDVESGISRVIGDRAFGTEPDAVAHRASAFARGMHRAGMARVGKHFPGHGGVICDSHHELPVDPRPLTALQARDLLPFRQLIADGLEGIMPAHVIYSDIDPMPAGFSRFWIQTVLRETLGFNGAVFSDDLSMAGARFAGGYPDRAAHALEAGCDMILVCNAPGAAAEVLDQMHSGWLGGDRQRRLERLRGGPATDLATLMATPQWHSTHLELAHLVNE